MPNLRRAWLGKVIWYRPLTFTESVVFIHTSQSKALIFFVCYVRAGSCVNIANNCRVASLVSGPMSPGGPTQAGQPERH